MRAIEQGTSLSAKVREFLQEYANEPQGRVQRQRAQATRRLMGSDACGGGGAACGRHGGCAAVSPRSTHAARRAVCRRLPRKRTQGARPQRRQGRSCHTPMRAADACPPLSSTPTFWRTAPTAPCLPINAARARWSKGCRLRARPWSARRCWSSCSTRSLASRSCRWRPRRRWCWPAPPGPWSTDLALVTGAVSNSIAQQVSIWDAMVIEAAFRAEAQALYSEDFAHGRHFGTLVVINPFLT